MANTRQKEKEMADGINSFIDSIEDRPPPRAVPQLIEGRTPDRPKENLQEENTPTLGRLIEDGSINGGATAAIGKGKTESKLAYGKYAGIKLDENDVEDRVFGLKSENLKLKEKENLLELEVKKMQTKLRRIDELLHAQKIHREGAACTDFSKLSRELDEQFGSFKDENTILKDRVRKLKTVFNGLSN